MPQYRQPDQGLALALATALLEGLDNGAGEEDDARLARDLSSTLDAYVHRLMPEDRERFADQVSVFPAFLAACRAFDRAHRAGDTEQAQRHRVEIEELRRRSERATKYVGLSHAAEALMKTRDLGEFCALLPLVPLDRLYGRDFRRVSPFPLIWAISSRTQPLERVRLMLSAGARLDLATGLGNTVLHAMARMSRKGRARLEILNLLVSAGADLQATNVHDKTPLAVALTDGSAADVGYFLAAGARVDIPEMTYAAETPERLKSVLDHVPDNPERVTTLIALQDLLAREIAQAEDHLRERPGRGRERKPISVA